MFINSVLQRIEYRYGDKDRLLAPKLDGAKKFGTYGMIELVVIFWYPTIPGKLYHPIDNAEEASWWLDFYNQTPEFKSVVFVPAPDQISTGVFTVPVIEDVPAPEETSEDWYTKWQFSVGPYGPEDS